MSDQDRYGDKPLNGLPSDGTEVPADQPPQQGPDGTPASGDAAGGGQEPPPPPPGSPYSQPDSPYESGAAARPPSSPYDAPSGGATPPPGDSSPYSAAGGTPGPDFSKPEGGSPYGDQPPPYPGGPGGPGYGEAPGGYGAAYGTPAQDPRLAGMPPLANLGKRVVARIIDYLIIYVPLSILIAITGGFGDIDDGSFGGGYGWSLLGIAAYFVYEGLMLTRSGQTVGKKVMHIRVAMLENGAVPAGNPGWIRSAVFHLPPLVPCIGTLFQLYNVLSCLWDRPYRQCVHDKAAKTVVVEARRA
ncbi:RDD family protein [Streptomyces sp. NPDC051940]|uniref:RDD family protein n=1 Tax=Streptomyces sp. NPDC051940 TaxID=3155675 RepID=UPI00341E496A